jgi:hypothetical protein
MARVDLGQVRVQLQAAAQLQAAGWQRLSDDSELLIQSVSDFAATSKWHAASLRLAVVAVDILAAEQPVTLRGLLYRVVSGGWLPSTADKNYSKLMRLMTILREAEVVPFDWIVDAVGLPWGIEDLETEQWHRITSHLVH